MKNTRSEFFIVLSILSFCAHAESQLEFLWKASIQNSSEYKSSCLALDYAEKVYKNKQSLYPFSFSTNISSSFTDVSPDVAWYTTNSTASAVVTKQNPFGNTVSGTLSYGISRNVLDALAKRVDSEAIGYSHSPSISLSVQQSLKPAIFKSKEHNSEVLVLQNNVLSASYAKNSVELSLYKAVASYYIQIRCILREVNKYKAYLDFYEQKIQATQELVKNSKISVSELWALENKKWEYYENYVQSVNSKENIELTLANLCGNAEMVKNADFFAVLPDYKKVFVDKNPEKQLVEAQIKNLTLQNIISEQGHAPVLSLGGTFSESTETDGSFAVNYINDKQNFNWSFSVGVSFSEFFSASKKLRGTLFNNNIAVCNAQIAELEKQTKNQLKNYQNLINECQSQLEQLNFVLLNRRALFADFENMYKDGKCSFLELQEVRLGVKEAECSYGNLADYLWLYKWQRSQCK